MSKEKIGPTTKEVRDIIQHFDSTHQQLNEILKSSERNIAAVSQAITQYIEMQVEKVLKEIDISEINRGEMSIRTSALKKAGYTNFYKIYKTSKASTLAHIDGISLDNAYKIKSFVYEDAERIRKSTVPRLSRDNKTAKADELVKILYIYLASLKYQELGYALQKNEYEINQYLEQCKPLKNKLVWFFTGKENKRLALDAYDNLQQLRDGKYSADVNYVIDNLTRIAIIKPSEAWKDFEKNSATYYAAMEKLEGINLNNVAVKNGLGKDLLAEIESVEPDFSGLNCTLRSYQDFGVKYILNQGKVLLGDEMGLGKTVQAIASMVAIRNVGENRFLVVCPASVLVNWCREIKKFSNLRVSKLHGEDRNQAFEDWVKYGGVGVTTFETASKLDFTNIFNISMLVVDEAHYIKNPKANRTANLVKICEKCERVLFMTGTALENRIDEMCYLMEQLNKDIVREIEGLKHLSKAPMFREKVAPVYLRRTRDDVLKELPDLTIAEEWCEMGAEEKSEYITNTMNQDFMSMRQVSWKLPDITKSSKAKRLLEIIDEAREDGRKVVIFSFFLNTIEKCRQLIGANCYGPINGSVPPEQRQEIIDEFSAGEDGSVLLAQIQAGGTGVNIQSASCVVICEPQLKPSTENQAISRTYRMGQTRNVLVYKLLCEDSVDERIEEILDTKQKIFDRFADISLIGEQSVEITEKMAKNIIASEVERLKNENK